MDLDLISSLEEYWGEVVDTADPIKGGRVRVKVKTVFDEIATEFIPWAAPRFVDASTFEKPYLGEVVQVIFDKGDIMMPKWFRIRGSDMEISDENYESYTSIKEKNLGDYGLDGKIDISYRADDGLTFALEREYNNSYITIRNDSSIVLKNGQTDRSIHINKDGISIGSEDKAQQPAVVGNDNMEALQKLNNTIKTLSDLMNKHLDLLSIAAGTSPYTKHLKTVFKSYKNEVKSVIKQLHSENDAFFPETKSNLITVDKD